MNYIDQEKLLQEIEESEPENWTDSEWEVQAMSDYRFYKSLVESQPTADVVEVVRCHECKHSMFSDFYCECNYHFKMVNPWDFCSYGQRKKV